MLQITPEAKDALRDYLSVLDMIERSKKDLFSMLFFETETQCGTVMCVAGYAASRTGDCPERYADYIVSCIEGDGVVTYESWDRLWGSFFGMSQDEPTPEQTLAKLNRRATWLLARIEAWEAWEEQRDAPKWLRVDHINHAERVLCH